MRGGLCETAASLCLLRRANPHLHSVTGVNLLPLGKVCPPVSELQLRCVSGMEKFKRGLLE